MMVVQPRYDILATGIDFIKWNTEHKCWQGIQTLTCYGLAVIIFDFIDYAAEYLLVNTILFSLSVIQFLVQISDINNAHLLFHMQKNCRLSTDKPNNTKK